MAKSKARWYGGVPYLVTKSDVRTSVFIVDDAYLMQNTPTKGGCVEFSMHLSVPLWMMIHISVAYV